MIVCSKICKECPFSTNSLSGWLADYTTNDIREFQSSEALFPCHLMLDSGLSQKEAEILIKRGELKLCRGYVESIIKSAKKPYLNKLLVQAVNIVREEGLSEESMPIWDFIKHHQK